MTTKVLQIPEPELPELCRRVEEVAISPYKITLISARTGRKVDLVADPVIEDGVVIGYTDKYLRRLSLVVK